MSAGLARSYSIHSHLLAPALVASAGHLGSLATRIVGIVRIVLSLQAHDRVRHLLGRVCGSRGRLEVLMRAHGRRHLRQLLVLRLLCVSRVDHIAAFPELLEILLQPQLRVGHVLLLLLLLLLLLRVWCFVVIDVCARSSAAHLRIGVGVGGRHVGLHRTRGGSWRSYMRLVREVVKGCYAAARGPVRSDKMVKREIEQRPREDLRLVDFTGLVLARQKAGPDAASRCV
jgi:hypothetical protein